MEWSDRYEILFGSDVVKDGVYLEARAKTTGEVVLLAFYSDADGSMSFEQHREALPAGFVEWFRSESQRRLPPADLHEAIAAFVGAFEEVFERDWYYARTMLSPVNIGSFIAPGGTFLNPGVDDEVEDWGARAELLDRYRQLLRVMQVHGIQPKKPW